MALPCPELIENKKQGAGRPMPAVLGEGTLAIPKASVPGEGGGGSQARLRLFKKLVSPLASVAMILLLRVDKDKVRK